MAEEKKENIERRLEQNSEESDSSSSGEEQDVEAVIAARTEQLQANPYDFALYCELIALHRAQGNLDETRSFRQQVQQYYSLPEEDWIAWLQDEIDLMGSEEESIQNIINLFETAL